MGVATYLQPIRLVRNTNRRSESQHAGKQHGMIKTAVEVEGKTIRCTRANGRHGAQLDQTAHHELLLKVVTRFFVAYLVPLV